VMPDLEPGTIERLAAVYPGYYIVQNPVDVTGSATSKDYRVGIQRLIEDRNVDVIMPWFVFQDTPLDEEIVDVLAELSGAKPILCGAMGGPYTEKMGRALEERSIPLFDGVRPWLAAARAVSYRANTKES
jgi:3-hydroxypropionyl-CoA synthetase (ADP-forming)